MTRETPLQEPPGGKRPTGRARYIVSTAEILIQAAFTLVVILRVWKGWDVTLQALAWGLGAGVYLLPAILLYRGAHPRRRSLALINLALGWTILGWAYCLDKAMTRSESRHSSF